MGVTGVNENNPTDSTYPSPAHQPQGVAAHGVASSTSGSSGILRVSSPPPGIPKLFYRMDTGLHVNHEGASYSVRGSKVGLEQAIAMRNSKKWMSRIGL
jgi:hypothetical protein